MAWGVLGVSTAREPAIDAAAVEADIHPAQVREFVHENCLDCHDDSTKTAGLSLETLSAAPIEEDSARWEHVVRRLRARQMPPLDAVRPDEKSYDMALASLEAVLDRAAAKTPQPGRAETLRRLNRSEYQNAIRDLLALEVDVDALLPPDDAGHGFDNVASGAVSPTLLARYVAAAQKISRLALGGAARSPAGHTIRLRPDITQEEHVAGLPLGTRGGTLLAHTFPQDGLYDINIRLMRDRNEHVEGLTRPHELEVLLDRASVASFKVLPPRNETEHATIDAHLTARIEVAAGPHELGVTFVKEP